MSRTCGSFEPRPGCARIKGWLLAAHFALCSGVMAVTLGVGGAVLFALVHHLLTGVYMASIFAPLIDLLYERGRLYARGRRPWLIRIFDLRLLRRGTRAAVSVKRSG